VKHGKINEENTCRCISFILVFRFFWLSLAIIKDSLMYDMPCLLLRTNGLQSVDTGHDARIVCKMQPVTLGVLCT